MAKIYFDAASAGNPGESAAAVVIKTDKSHVHFTKGLGLMDNHSAEWEALVFAMTCAAAEGVDTALVYTDSKLIEDSLNRGRVKNEKFKPFYEQVLRLSEAFNLFFVKWLPRSQNKAANHYAREALYQIQKQKKH